MKVQNIVDYLKSKEVDLVCYGDIDARIDTFSSIYSPKPFSLSWIRDISTIDIEKVNNTPSIVIIMPDFNNKFNNDIVQMVVADPYKVYFTIINEFFYKRENVIGNFSDIQTKNIGEGFSHGSYVKIGPEVSIGANCSISDFVSINGPVTIGDNVIIQSGVKIGDAGYGYFMDLEGFEKRIPHLGSIIIKNNVEIGANCTIVRAGLGNTVIGNNVKIDNLCHIAHNVSIGDNTKITAMTMIAGSAIIGERCWIAPGCNIMNQVKIDNECFLGMGAVVTKDIPKNSLAVGVPAKVIKEYYPNGERK